MAGAGILWPGAHRSDTARRSRCQGRDPRAGLARIAQTYSGAANQATEAWVAPVLRNVPRQPQVFQSTSLIDLDGCILTSGP